MNCFLNGIIPTCIRWKHCPIHLNALLFSLHLLFRLASLTIVFSPHNLYWDCSSLTIFYVTMLHSMLLQNWIKTNHLLFRNLFWQWHDSWNSQNFILNHCTVCCSFMLQLNSYTAVVTIFSYHMTAFLQTMLLFSN